MEERSVEEIESLYKSLTTRREALVQDVNRVTITRDERKRLLKETIEECKKDGYNPDTLAQDMQHAKQVLITKMDVLSADLTEAEAIVRPMLREIEKG